MKKYLVVIFFLLTAVAGNAQDKKKFDPEKFDAEMEKFIAQQAHLDQQEAAKFFPILKEMHQKQRSVYGHMRALGKSKPNDEAGCAEAIKLRDKCNLELKQLEKCYHQKMLTVISASKLYDAIQAENRFYRSKMKGWQKPNSHGR